MISCVCGGRVGKVLIRFRQTTKHDLALRPAGMMRASGRVSCIASRGVMESPPVTSHPGFYLNKRTHNSVCSRFKERDPSDGVDPQIHLLHGDLPPMLCPAPQWIMGKDKGQGTEADPLRTADSHLRGKD